MLIRPVDSSGDMLPVLSSSRMLRGTEAVAQLIRDRLALLSGDWWENPAWGNEVLEMLQGSRLTEGDRQAVASYIASYIRDTPGVMNVRDAACSVNGRQLQYSCTVDTADGSAVIDYAI